MPRAWAVPPQVLPLRRASTCTVKQFAGLGRVQKQLMSFSNSGPPATCGTGQRSQFMMGMPALTRPQKITFAEMRAPGLRGGRDVAVRSPMPMDVGGDD
jgi:hypothetical protein